MPEPGSFFSIVQVDEMAFAMSLFVSAASLRTSKSLPKKLVVPSGECWEILGLLTESMRREMPPPKHAESESSLEHAFVTLWMHYEGEVLQRSICARVLGFHALMTMSQGALVADWVLSPEDSPEIIVLHPAVVKAVGMTPLDERGTMVRPEFLRTLEMIAHTETEQAA